MLLATAAHAEVTSDAVGAQALTYEDFLTCKDDRMYGAGLFPECDELSLRAFCNDAMRGVLDETAPTRACATSLRVWRACKETNRTATCSTAVRSGTSEELVHKFARRYDSVDAASTPYAPALLRGTTDFFVDRAQKELVYFLIQELGGDVCGTASTPKPAADLMPRTCQVLRTDGISAATAATLALPSTLRADFDELPSKLVARVFAKVPSDNTKLAAGACFAALLSTAVRPMLAQGAPEALEWLADPAVYPSICVQARVPLRDLATALRDARTVLVAAIKRARADKSVDVAALVASMKEDLSGGVTSMPWLAAARGPMSRLAVASARMMDGVQPSEEQTKEYIAATFELLVAAADTFPEGKNHHEVVFALADAMGAFAQRRYSVGVLRLISNSAVQDALSVRGAEDSTKDAVDALAKHFATVAALADARKPEEAKAALEAAAAPLGSWREYRRRTAGFVAGQFGVAAGGELPLGAGASGAIVGPTLPIGIEIAGPIGHDWTVGVFVSMLDVGGIAMTRVDSSATSANTGHGNDASIEPELTFASVLAPGAALTVGLGKTPFVFVAGVDLAPANRRFFACATNCAGTLNSTVRVHGALSVDLPVLPIF